ncbi:MAG: hypothetical protein E7285_04280 [Lachnospiraceae bacterium]|nr:hypothetical protein [Lachnospiraceae bacterium]
MKKRISEMVSGNLTLCELLAGILFFGMLCQIVGCIFLKENLLYHSVGLWLGAVVAMLMAVHMNASIQKAVVLDADSAEKVARKDTILRYFAIVLILGVMMVLDFANPLTAFLGIMGLKVAAYGQPLTHKLFHKFIKEENIS